jgi:hypothetical protein
MEKLDPEKHRQQIEKLKNLAARLRNVREDRKKSPDIGKIVKAIEKVRTPSKTPLPDSSRDGVDQQEPFYSKMPQELRKSDCSPLGKLVFTILHGYCQNKRLADLPEAEVTLKTICNEARRGETKVRAALVGLERAGWIEIIRQGVKKPNRYRLHPNSLKAREDKSKLEQTHRRVLRDEELRKRLAVKPQTTE